MNNGIEIGSDLIVGNGVSCSTLVQSDSQKLLQQLVLVEILVFHRHFERKWKTEEGERGVELMEINPNKTKGE